MYKILSILLFTYGLCLTTDDIYDNSWALIIGIDKYENVHKLNYAVDDAESIKDILINSFNFPEENVSLLINEKASKQNIIKSFSTITKNAKSNDRVVVFFAGHGETMDLPGGGEKGYLIPVEGDANDLYVTSIPMDELKQIALMSEAKHMLYLVDACYGGIAAVGSRGLAPEETPTYLKKVTKFQSRQVITAGGRGEKVIEKPEWGHSAFTLNLKRGLKEGAADMNSDGYITANELGMFLTEKVTIDSENQQTPQFGRMTSQEGEFVFVYNEDSKSLKQISKNSELDNEQLDLILSELEQLKSKNNNQSMLNNINNNSIDYRPTLSFIFNESNFIIGMWKYYDSKSAGFILFGHQNYDVIDMVENAQELGDAFITTYGDEYTWKKYIFYPMIGYKLRKGNSNLFNPLAVVTVPIGFTSVTNTTKNYTDNIIDMSIAFSIVNKTYIWKKIGFTAGVGIELYHNIGFDINHNLVKGNLTYLFPTPMFTIDIADPFSIFRKVLK